MRPRLLATALAALFTLVPSGGGALAQPDTPGPGDKKPATASPTLESDLSMPMGYYFMEIHGYARNEWLMIFLASGIMMIIGGVVSGYVMDRIGRKIGFIIGAGGFALSLFLLGFGPEALLPVMGALTGFFIAFAYAWVIVYIPEIFPTERRGACLGWTTTVARISYIVGPVIAALILEANPTMEWFWVVGGLFMILAIIIVLLFHPYETKTKELEEIEVHRENSF